MSAAKMCLLENAIWLKAKASSGKARASRRLSHLLDLEVVLKLLNSPIGTQPKKYSSILLPKKAIFF